MRNALHLCHAIVLLGGELKEELGHSELEEGDCAIYVLD
jgi:hypothetical protein